MADTNSSLAFEGESQFTYEERVVVAVIALIIFVCGTLGNSIVILAVILSQVLQNSTNVFVVSLAVADLSYCLLLPISFIMPSLSVNGWPWESEALCSISALMSFTCAGASLYNLACIALNRLLLIRGPVTVCQWLFTPRKIVCLVVFTWVIPLAALLIPLPFGIGEFGYDQGDHTCSDIDLHPRYVDYHLIQAFCLYPIPLITIVVSYFLIFLHVRRHFERKEESFRESHEMITIEGEQDDNTRQLEARFKKRVSRQQLQITKNLFVVTCAFVLFSAPYCFALLSPHNNRVLLFLCVPFAFNSCVNPIIYTANHPRFTGVIRCILRCRFGNIPRPSNVLVSVRAKLRPTQIQP